MVLVVMCEKEKEMGWRQGGCGKKYSQKIVSNSVDHKNSQKFTKIHKKSQKITKNHEKSQKITKVYRFGLLQLCCNCGVILPSNAQL